MIIHCLSFLHSFILSPLLNIFPFYLKNIETFSHSAMPSSQTQMKCDEKIPHETMNAWRFGFRLFSLTGFFSHNVHTTCATMSVFSFWEWNVYYFFSENIVWSSFVSLSQFVSYVRIGKTWISARSSGVYICVCSSDQWSSAWSDLNTIFLIASLTSSKYVLWIMTHNSSGFSFACNETWKWTG